VTSEIPKTVIQNAGAVGGQVEINAIVMRDLNWHVEASPEPGVPIEYVINWKLEHVRYQPTGLVYRVWADITGTSSEKTIFTLSVAHEAFFGVDPEFAAEEEQIQNFGGLSVMPMVYPYVRETLGRLSLGGGLPPIILAPLKLPFYSALLETVTTAEGAVD
jgi:preprotein translocase subunit SecB